MPSCGRRSRSGDRSAGTSRSACPRCRRCSRPRSRARGWGGRAWPGRAAAGSSRGTAPPRRPRPTGVVKATATAHAATASSRQDSRATCHPVGDCVTAPSVVRRITSATLLGVVPGGHVAAVAQHLGAHPGRHVVGRVDGAVAVGPGQRDRHVDLVEALEQRAAHLVVGAVEARRRGRRRGSAGRRRPAARSRDGRSARSGPAAVRARVRSSGFSDRQQAPRGLARDLRARARARGARSRRRTAPVTLRQRSVFANSSATHAAERDARHVRALDLRARRAWRRSSAAISPRGRAGLVGQLGRLAEARHVHGDAVVVLGQERQHRLPHPAVGAEGVDEHQRRRRPRRGRRPSRGSPCELMRSRSEPTWT